MALTKKLAFGQKLMTSAFEFLIQNVKSEHQAKFEAKFANNRLLQCELMTVKNEVVEFLLSQMPEDFCNTTEVLEKIIEFNESARQSGTEEKERERTKVKGTHQALASFSATRANSSDSDSIVSGGSIFDNPLVVNQEDAIPVTAASIRISPTTGVIEVENIWNSVLIERMIQSGLFPPDSDLTLIAARIGFEYLANDLTQANPQLGFGFGMLAPILHAQWKDHSAVNIYWELLGSTLETVVNHKLSTEAAVNPQLLACVGIPHGEKLVLRVLAILIDEYYGKALMVRENITPRDMKNLTQIKFIYQITESEYQIKPQEVLQALAFLYSIFRDIGIQTMAKNIDKAASVQLAKIEDYSKLTIAVPKGLLSDLYLQATRAHLFAVRAMSSEKEMSEAEYSELSWRVGQHTKMAIEANDWESAIAAAENGFEQRVFKMARETVSMSSEQLLSLYGILRTPGLDPHFVLHENILRSLTHNAHIGQQVVTFLAERNHVLYVPPDRSSPVPVPQLLSERGVNSNAALIKVDFKDRAACQAFEYLMHYGYGVFRQHLQSRSTGPSETDLVRAYIDLTEMLLSNKIDVNNAKKMGQTLLSIINPTGAFYQNMTGLLNESSELGVYQFLLRFNYLLCKQYVAKEDMDALDHLASILRDTGNLESQKLTIQAKIERMWAYVGVKACVKNIHFKAFAALSNPQNTKFSVAIQNSLTYYAVEANLVAYAMKDMLGFPEEEEYLTAKRTLLPRFTIDTATASPRLPTESMFNLVIGKNGSTFTPVVRQSMPGHTSPLSESSTNLGNGNPAKAGPTFFLPGESKEDEEKAFPLLYVLANELTDKDRVEFIRVFERDQVLMKEPKSCSVSDWHQALVLVENTSLLPRAECTKLRNLILYMARQVGYVPFVVPSLFSGDRLNAVLAFSDRISDTTNPWSITSIIPKFGLECFKQFLDFTRGEALHLQFRMLSEQLFASKIAVSDQAIQISMGSLIEKISSDAILSLKLKAILAEPQVSTPYAFVATFLLYYYEMYLAAFKQNMDTPACRFMAALIQEGPVERERYIDAMNLLYQEAGAKGLLLAADPGVSAQLFEAWQRELPLMVMQEGESIPWVTFAYLASVRALYCSNDKEKLNFHEAYDFVSRNVRVNTKSAETVLERLSTALPPTAKVSFLQHYKTFVVPELQKSVVNITAEDIRQIAKIIEGSRIINPLYKSAMLATIGVKMEAVEETDEGLTTVSLARAIRYA